MVARLSLHTRISLVLTALAASLLLVAGGLWLKSTREGIHEEVEAASRVSEQWLTVAARETRSDLPAWTIERLLAHVKAVGRIRANTLEVVDAAGRRRYLSPPPSYKAGRAAPGWFAGAVEPAFAPRRIEAGPVTLILYPDPSRATLDAWDDLSAMAGWACTMLLALFLASRLALDRALRPLGQVMAALDRTGRGRFDTRLPVYAVPELGRLAHAFNGMADRLADSVNQNVRLESEREVSRQLQARLEAERRSIARELHDELAQGITAVRALAGAIAQRTTEQPALYGHAQSIVAVTGQMQDGVRTILRRLRPIVREDAADLDESLRSYLEAWQQRHPNIVLHAELAAGPAPVGDEIALAVLRIVQESLTNVSRHAAATRVDVALRRLREAGGDWLEITLADNGRGLSSPSPGAGCGLGLTGMRERTAALAGEVSIDSEAGGGVRVCARLPAGIGIPLEERT